MNCGTLCGFKIILRLLIFKAFFHGFEQKLPQPTTRKRTFSEIPYFSDKLYCIADIFNCICSSNAFNLVQELLMNEGSMGDNSTDPLTLLKDLSSLLNTSGGIGGVDEMKRVTL